MADSTLLTPPTSRLAAIRQWLLLPTNQLLLLLLVLAAFPLLYELGRSPVQLWDESRQAVNALEMSRTGNLLVTTFGGTPDHHSTKPPFLIWFEALSFRLFGYNTWALRLPTAICTMGTVVLLFQFAAHTLRRPLAGFFGGLVLVTTVGYVTIHGARTGDYDAMLTFWLTISWIAFFHYLERGQRHDLYWLAGSLVAATLTKSVAGLLGVPALLAYAVVRGKLPWLLRQPRLYVVAAGGLAIVAGYYLAHEAVAPGYLAAVSVKELGGRFNEVIEGHAAPWSYYFDSLYTRDFAHWVWWLLPALLIWVQPERTVRWAGVLLVLFIVSWYLLISSAATKVDWYPIPTFPALALLTGLGLDRLHQDVMGANLPRLARWLVWPVRIAVVVGLFYFPYRTIVRNIIAERTSDFDLDGDGHLARYVAQVTREQPALDTLVLINHGGYNSSLMFYQGALSLHAPKYVALRYHNDARSLRPGTVALVCNPVFRAQLDSAFQLVTLHQESTCETLLLLPHK